jgi:hypothetical protein
VQWHGGWRNAEAVQPVRPEGLVDQDGYRDRRYSRAQPGPGGAGSGVVDHGSREPAAVVQSMLTVTIGGFR